nr:AAA family ATPase [Caballeronia sp. TF1N1]
MEFLAAVEACDPPIRAMGITDYYGIEGYERAVELKAKGNLASVGLIFPNVELRLTIETSRASAINLHLLFRPDDHNHVERIHRFLRELKFSYLGETYRCDRDDLIRLGRAHDPKAVDDNAARRAGANQFKVTLENLKRALETSDWARANVLIAVAGGEKDGTSGLRDEEASFAALRTEIERFAHIIFSGNPKQSSFWLGHEKISVAELTEKYGGPKPCLHGSDAHTVTKVGKPDSNRFCWVKGDLVYETLRQLCLEPSQRVFIGEEPPLGALNGNIIKSVEVTNAPWLYQSRIELNSGLVAIIGARGSGKTALADIIAAGGLALSQRLNEKSFISRAKDFLRNSEARLRWAEGDDTYNGLTMTGMEELLDHPHVQYLSQQFVDQLCSSDGPNDELIDEIERVIFNAHPASDRLGASDFKELLLKRLESSRQKRRRNQLALEKASLELTEERALKDSLPHLEKDRDERRKAIDKDKKDRMALVGKGNVERASRLELVSNAVDMKQQEVNQAKLKLRALELLETDVANFREREAPLLVQTMQLERSESGLSKEDWKQFKIDFVGEVDSILVTRVAEAQKEVLKLQGVATNVDTEANPEAPLIAEDVQLLTHPLAVLERERERLKRLVGIDVQNTRRFNALSDKITKAEGVLTKINQNIERAKSAEERITKLIKARREAYAAVYEAIVEEEAQLAILYAPIKARIEEAGGSLSKLSFSIRRTVDLEKWAATGESLLDLRRNGPFQGRGSLFQRAHLKLLQTWESGDAPTASAAVLEFVKTNEADLRLHMPEGENKRDWAKRVSDWLLSTDHISVGYGLQYDGVDIEQLSPGTRGIVLLLLYLAIDGTDDRPLIIDQPEENLDPQSIFDELVTRFREAKRRRQIIIVTHNANLVVNTDADQVIVASSGQHKPAQLPVIQYEMGGLENKRIRQRVCDILEGGEHAFKERAKRLRVVI